MSRLAARLRRLLDLRFKVPYQGDWPWSAEAEPLRRLLLVMHPRQPYVDWVISIRKDKPRYTLQQAQADSSIAFLVPTRSNSADETLAFIEEHWFHFQVEALLLWSNDEFTWPIRPTLDKFHQWFEFQYCGKVLDLGGYRDSGADGSDD